MELFQLFGRIAVDNTEANNAIDGTAKRANDSNDKINKAFKGIGSAAVSVGKVIAGAGLAIGGSMFAITESTREYRQEMGLLDSAYQTAGHSSEAAKSTYSDLNAVMRDSGAAVEAAQHLALITDSEEELNDATHTLTGIYATFGSSLPLESISEAINHSSKLGEVQGSLADALEWSGITVDDFNAQLAECSTEEQRQDLIMSTLRNTYSKAADQYKETNKDIMEAEKANEKLSDAFAELGRVFEPIVTNVKTKIADMVADAAPKIEELIDKFKDASKWVKDNEDKINTWVGVIIGATVAVGMFLLIFNWGTIMTAAANAVMGVRLAILALNAAIRANPIGFLISLVTGLISTIIYLWQTNDEFRQFWIDMWKKIQDATSKAVEAVKKWWKNMSDDMKEKFTSMKQKATEIFENIRTTISSKVQSAKDLASATFTKLKANIISPITEAKNKVVEVFGIIYSTMKEKIESARDKVDSAIQKIKGFFPLSIGKIFSNLKIPSISVSGGKAPYGIAGKGKLPSFSVNWNAEGGIFDNPTIIPTLAGFQGVGEAGAEAITPIDTLLEYVTEAVRSQNEPILYYMQNIVAMMAEYMPEMANNKAEIMLDGNALVGRLAPMIDQELGILANRKQRGNI